MSKEPKRNVYVGHRYVPKVMGEWDKAETYEGLSIVTNKGTSYTSKKRVPKGIDILNEEYWVVTGNYNAQIEEYRKDVKKVSEDLEKNKEEIYTHVSVIAVNSKDFNAKGDGVTDDTDAIQKAIDYVTSIGGGNVIIPEGEYMIKAHVQDTLATKYLGDEGGLALKDNVKLLMSPKTILKAIPNNKEQYQIIRSYNKKNVSIIGGQIIGERYSHGGTTGEWGYGIAITGGENILIDNVTVNDCWGDGINIQVYRNNGDSNSSKNVTIRNVYTNNNRRQGMSIEGLINGLIENSIFSNTKGTLPECGVDIEPWDNAHKVENVVFKECTFKNNNGGGLTIMGSGISRVNVESCLFENNVSKEAQLPISFCQDITIKNSHFYGGVQMVSITLAKNILVANNTIKTVLGVVNSSSDVRIDDNYINTSHRDVYDLLTVPLYKEKNLTKDLVFRNNIVIGSDQFNTRNLLFFEGGNNTLIEGNKFQNAIGVIKTGSESKGMKILNNKFENFKNYAITGGSVLILNDNIFTGGCYGNKGQPIVVSYSEIPHIMTRNIAFKNPTSETDKTPQFGSFANNDTSFLLNEGNHVLDNV